MTAPHSRLLLALLPFALAVLPAQDPPKPGSPQSQALLDKACAKMLAFGRGTFRTSEEQDSAIARRMKRGNSEPAVTVVEGGWLADLLWARAGADAELIVRQHGRTLVQTGKDWRIRRDKLPTGTPLPALFDAELFFQVVRDLPAEARRVVAVEPAKIGETSVLVLALSIEGETARDFTQTGALPPVLMAMGPTIMNTNGVSYMPQPPTTIDIGLFVEPEGGDVLCVRAKVCEKGPGPGPGGAGGPAAPAGAEKGAEPPKETSELVYKQGLPERELGQRDSSMSLKVDFAGLGKAKPPELDDAPRKLLGGR